jgi:hypothetical protein
MPFGLNQIDKAAWDAYLLTLSALWLRIISSGWFKWCNSYKRSWSQKVWTFFFWSMTMWMYKLLRSYSSIVLDLRIICLLSWVISCSGSCPWRMHWRIFSSLPSFYPSNTSIILPFPALSQFRQCKMSLGEGGSTIHEWLIYSIVPFLVQLLSRIMIRRFL